MTSCINNEIQSLEEISVAMISIALLLQNSNFQSLDFKVYCNIKVKSLAGKSSFDFIPFKRNF